MNIKALESCVYDVLRAIQHTSAVIDGRVASIALNDWSLRNKDCSIKSFF